MNKLKYICLTLKITFFHFAANCQFMQNGGFELTNNQFIGISIDRANAWHTIYNSPDLFHNQITNTNNNQHTGQGCAGFGSEFVSLSEYFYGTTESLVANTKYILTCFVKNANPSNSLSIGIKISNIVPSPTFLQNSSTPVNAVSNYLINPINQPDFIYKPIGDQYNQVTFCFTPEQSGLHYVIFGNYNDQNPNFSNFFYLDDVDISFANIEQQNLNSLINPVSNSFCINSPITFDGSLSQNETSYNWEIYPSNNPTPIYTGSIQNGSAGMIEINSIFNSINFLPNPGDCFIIKLNTFNGCKETAEYEFCYDNIDINFENLPDVLCEGIPYTIVANGSSNWFYSWSTGETGLGLNSVQFNPVYPSTECVLTVTSQNGCIATESINIPVQSGFNFPPYLSGINNTNEYIAYVHTNDEICFNISSFDSPNETVSMTWDNGIPDAFFSTQGSPLMNGIFCWNTDNVNEGSYFFDVTVNDNSQCGQSLSSTYTFQINVVCENCHICISLDGNSNSTTAPPNFIEAASCILAGIDGNYFIGINNSVLFQAGNYIEIGPAFDTQDGLFEAVVDPVTCLTGCSNCCENFNGFTIDYPLPNVFTPNNDGINDIFFFRDNDNQTCAFNATKFDFYVINSLGAIVYHLEEEIFNSQICCPFIAPDNNTPSSIFWNGIINVGLGTGQMVLEDTYFWTLELFNCNNSLMLNGFLDVVDPSNSDIQNEEIEEQNYILDNSFSDNPSQVSINTKINLIVYPNPATDKLFVYSEKKIKNITIFDSNNHLVLNKMNYLDKALNVSLLSSGEYRIEIEFTDNSHQNKGFIKI